MESELAELKTQLKREQQLRAKAENVSIFSFAVCTYIVRLSLPVCVFICCGKRAVHRTHIKQACTHWHAHTYTNAGEENCERPAVAADSSGATETKAKKVTHANTLDQSNAGEEHCERPAVATDSPGATETKAGRPFQFYRGPGGFGLSCSLL